MVRRALQVTGRRLSEKGHQLRRAGWRDLLNPTFAGEINMEERYRAWRRTISRTAPTEREAHYRMLTHSMHAFALETHDGAAAAFAIEKRYPFWDKRLVEFCLGLPSTQKINQGRTRVVLRRAMEGVLPPSIQWREGKTNFIPSLDYGIRTFERGQLDDVISGMSGVLADYVDIPALSQVRERFLKTDVPTDPFDIFTLFKTVSLASWLEDQGSENREPNRRTLRGGDSNVTRFSEYEVLRHSYTNSRRGKLNATSKRKSREENLRIANCHRSG
jgi:asparagine synthase (glutamine-hydrolysing)